MQYSLVIFDFDDTLVHLDVDWKAVKLEVLAIAAKSGVQADAGAHLIAITDSLSENPKLRTQIDAVFRRHELECARSRAYVPFPAMLSVVKALRAHPCRLAIASGNHSDSINSILAEIGFAKEFDFVCGREKVSRNKPHPDQLLLILKELGVGRDSAVFIGNSVFDRMAAAAAGMGHISVRPDSQADAAKVSRILGLCGP
ncbi:HAD hydrolase-like protein [Candidatus Micrarchaeota archaeon]|nr:HAD hydrolase-like protein [Candidatus Micrarchaeota archaeon]